MSMARVLDRNIRALLEHRQGQRGSRSRQERIADAVTRFTGSTHFVCIHLVVMETMEAQERAAGTQSST